ncbi:hypothetical protein PF008_g26919 [Phytophthora fragariae]|uniref:RxLR effector protein n=1 Tax=Phytophthora fragariae TaxID=53985 RepID=A0A6G0QGI6_9STRA|nr:hypothetical protein PF008_g26919 [Phytophthora fragariae]
MHVQYWIFIFICSINIQFGHSCNGDFSIDLRKRKVNSATVKKQDLIGQNICRL